MFTGIVEATGVVSQVEGSAAGRRIGRAATFGMAQFLAVLPWAGYDCGIPG